MAVIKKIKKTINSIKLCAVFTAICFMISTLGANLYAIPMSENPSKKYEDVFNKTSVISGEYGKITSFKDAKSDTTVINIQDLHCHPQTQKNISKIIEQIKDKYNLTSIYVEGGYGDINTGWLDEIKDKQIKKQVINKLLEEGILTGSEYFVLSSGTKNVDFKGIDEESLHKDNVKRLSRIISNQPKYDEVIKKVSKEINILEKMYINKRNVRFNESIENYLAGKIDVKRFYRQLIKYVNDINKNPQKYNNITSVKLEDYPNIVGYMSLKKTSQELDINKVTQELKEVITVLKNKIPYNVYSRLLKDTDNFNDSQKTVELLTLLCERENINLDNYSHLNHFLKMNDLGAKINTVKLVFEERQLIEQIKMALSYNMQEYEITYISDFEKYFKDYLQYKLTETDWAYFKQGFKKFMDIYEKYASVNRIKEIENDFEDLNKYYEINDNRNNIFVNRVLDGTNAQHISNSNRYEQEILKDSKQIIVAVTGGFHSEALEELLIKKGVNTLVVTPSIYDSTEQANKTYCDIIEQQSKINSQALAYTLASCSDDRYQKELLLTAVIRTLGIKNPAQLKEILPNVDLTEIENISEMSDEDYERKYKNFREPIEEAVNEIVNSLGDMKNVVFPSKEFIDSAMIKMVASLIERGKIFFSEGAIFEIENSPFNGKDLDSIPAEIYSRMMPSLQKALLLIEVTKTRAIPFGADSLKQDEEIVVNGQKVNLDSVSGEPLYLWLDAVENKWKLLNSADKDKKVEEQKEKVKAKQTKDIKEILRQAQINKQVVYLSDILKTQVLIHKKDDNGNESYNEAIIKYDESKGEWVLVSSDELNDKYKSLEKAISDKIQEFMAQFTGLSGEQILKNEKNAYILSLAVLGIIRGVQRKNKSKAKNLKEIIDGFKVEDVEDIEKEDGKKGNIKGYFAEYFVKYFVKKYLSPEYRLSMPTNPNQEGYDLVTPEGYRIQIKAANKRINNSDPSKRDIVGHAIDKFKGIPVFATSEIAGEYGDSDKVFSYGISNDFFKSIAEFLFDTLKDVTDEEIKSTEQDFIEESDEVFIKENDEYIDADIFNNFINLMRVKLNLNGGVFFVSENENFSDTNVNAESESDTSLPDDVAEASIFSGVKDKSSIFDFLYSKAHIWEELLFRTAPAIVAIINPMIGIPLFLVMQPLFIFSHSIVKWLVQKDSAGEDALSLKEIAKKDFKNLLLPTVAMSLPYIISFALPIFTPAVTALSTKIISLTTATAVAQFAHYEYNKNQKDSSKSLSVLSFKAMYNKIRLIHRHIETLKRELRDDTVYENVKESIKNDKAFHKEFTPRRDQSIAFAKQIEEKLKEKGIVIENLSERIEQNIDNLNKFSVLLTQMYEILTNIKFLEQEVSTIYLQKLIFGLKENFISLLENEFCEALISVYDDKTFTKKHVQNVYKFARMISEHTAFNDDLEFKYMVVISAALHDIGKNIIPAEILNKPSILTDEEYEIIKMHTLFGGLIMDGSIFESFSAGAKDHHKNKHYGYDTEIGKLLPEIRLPIETETDPILELITGIINISDVYDALISERQYKKPISPDKAFEIIVGKTPRQIAEQITNVMYKKETEYNEEALFYFVDWYFGELSYEELRSQLFVPSEEENQEPILTMAWLKKLLDFFPVKQNTKLKIVSIVEAPIIMLGILFPSVNDFFLNQHKVSETNRQKLEIRLDFLERSIKNKFVSAYKLVKEKIRIAVISPVIAFCFALIKAFDINKNLHYYFNKFVYDSTYDNDDKAGIIKLIEKNKNKITNAQNSYAHLYEELLFRTVPAIVAMINPMIGIPLFLVMQPLFIFAHSIVKWVVDILPNDKDVTLKETFKNDFRSLSLPSAILTLPFIISLALPIVTPVANLLSVKIVSLSASTALSQFIHYEYNKNTDVELQLKVHKKNKKSKKNKITGNNVSYVDDNDIRQPRGYTIRDILNNIIRLAKSKTSSYKDLELTQKQIKDFLLRSGVSQKEIDEIDFTQGYLPENIVSLLKSKNTQVVGTTIDPKKTLIENLKQSPILFSLAIEAFLRAYGNKFNKDSTLGDLLTFMDERYSRKLYEATCTDLRGYFGEIYVVNTLISGIIPDKRAGPIIIRPEMPSENDARGFDVYDINRTKIQVKTGGKEIITHHFIKYWRSITANSGQGIIAIPVLTTKNIKNNNFYRDDRVQGLDVTTEAVTKFAHEIVSALHKIEYKKSMRGARDLKLVDLINSFKGFPTEDLITTEELIDLLTSNNQMVAFERRKKDTEQENLQQETEPQQIPQVIEFKPNVVNIEDIIGQNVVVRTNSGRVRVIYVDRNAVSMNEKWRGVLGRSEWVSYGIEDIVYDNNGNIIDIEFEDGAVVSCLTIDKEPTGAKENNLDFSREELEKLYSDTQTDDYIDIYLDDDVDVISKNIENAARTNKLIVVHIFKEGFKTSDLTLAQIFEKYRQAYGLISNRFKLSDIFNSLTEDSKYTDFTLDFFFQEMLKNALVHGNVGKCEAPIALYIKLDDAGQKIQTFSIYNKVSDERITKETEVLTTSAHLTGDHMGNEIMEHNPLRTLSVGEQKIDGMKFWRARAVLRDSIDMQNVQWEQDYKNPKAKTQQEMLEEFWSVLPENVGMVNEELQKGKTVLQTVISVALAEIDDSLSPDFEQRHTTLEGKYGAKQIRNFLEKYLPVADKVSKVSVRLGNLVRKIVIGASVIKHVIIDYRYIKASGLQEAINMFGNNTYIDENGQIHIPPVLISQDMEELAQKYELRNTGIKVNGNSIYQIGTDGILVYGAKDVSLQEISKVINESAQIKSEIEKMLSKQGADNITIEVDGVMYGQQEGISFEDGITIIGMQELKGKSSEYINGYVTSALEIKRSMAISYGQKMIISLESINEKEKLYKALTEGKTRKIISEQQYRDLDLSEQEILNLRQQGIEIYVDTDKEADEYKQNGLSGRIERKDGKIYIKDFYSQDEIEVEQIGEDESLSAIESKIITSDKPVMIDIKILANKFNQERDITDKYGALGAMVGGFISNIKVKVGIGEITKQDIENIGYNLDYNKIPVISNNINKEEFLNATAEQVIEMLSIQDNSEIGIMIKGIKKQDIRDKFVDVIKARVMAKTALTEKYKEFGLKDKKLEKLLGEMLKKQVLNKDKNTVNIENGFTGTKEEVIRKIMQESQKAYNNDEVAINTIIEIILVYGEEYKQKQVSRVLDANDMRTYRSMLAAA